MRSILLNLDKVRATNNIDYTWKYLLRYYICNQLKVVNGNISIYRYMTYLSHMTGISEESCKLYLSDKKTTIPAKETVFLIAAGLELTAEEAFALIWSRDKLCMLGDTVYSEAFKILKKKLKKENKAKEIYELFIKNGIKISSSWNLAN